MKHLHRLTYNTLSKKPHRYTYQFGMTKNILIEISKNAVSISAELNNVYDAKEMCSNNCYLFPDAIRKALLLHILIYSQGISVKTIKVQIDNNEERINISGATKPYCLISDRGLISEIPSCWNNVSIISNILKQTQSKADSRMAALYAYICGKDKIFETERFLYFWMAFNGLYGYLSKCISLSINQQINKEYRQIKYMQQFLGVGDETISDKQEKSKIANEVIAVLKRNKQITSAELKNNDNKTQQIIKSLLVRQNGDPYNLTAYGYLLTQLTYYFRCNLFHAGKPMALIAFENDNQLAILKILNSLLEEYLDENLSKWFDNNFLENDLKCFIESCQ